jgi:FtsZ-interacting cell division protein ZipA
MESQAAPKQRTAVLSVLRLITIIIIVVVTGIWAVYQLKDNNTRTKGRHGRRLNLPDVSHQQQYRDQLARAARMTEMREQHRQNELARRQRKIVDSSHSEERKAKEKSDSRDPVAEMLKNSTDIILNGVFGKMVCYCLLCKIHLWLNRMVSYRQVLFPLYII